MRSIRRRSVALLTLALYLSGCSFPATRDLLPPRDIPKIDAKAPYLRLHYKDGRLAEQHSGLVTDGNGERLKPKRKPKGATLVSVETPADARHAWVRGNGTLYDASRDVIRTGDVFVAIDSLAIAESNVAHPNILGTVLLTITVFVLVVAATVALICALDPKACFGSCPTFYVTDGTHDVLAAEGFSASVAPALEATDVDALFHAQPQGRSVDITMRNEAFETHVVRSVTLLAAPRARGARVFRTRTGEYWQARVVGGPLRAMAAEGDVAPSLREFDGAERFSRADSTDLATRETIGLEFPRADGGELGSPSPAGSPCSRRSCSTRRWPTWERVPPTGWRASTAPTLRSALRARGSGTCSAASRSSSAIASACGARSRRFARPGRSRPTCTSCACLPARRATRRSGSS
jgi:hypothetical protein